MLEKTFAAHFPSGRHGYNPNSPRLSGSEDFSILATAVEKPSTFFLYGGVDPEAWDEAERMGTILEDIPVSHGPFYAPVVQPTLRVGVDGYVGAALTWLIR